jgi:hypothetical protein
MGCCAEASPVTAAIRYRQRRRGMKPALDAVVAVWQGIS